MGKKVQLKKYLKFAPLFLAIFIAGCASSGGGLPLEVRVNHRGNVVGTDRTPAEVLPACPPQQMIICKSFGSQKYCSCGHPSRVLGF